MTDIATVATSPDWLPHAYDAARRNVQFVRFSHDVIESPLFLADHLPADPADAVWIDESEVVRLQTEAPTPHFIFHTAFCRSTLLVRALHASRRATGLNEPGILNSLAEIDRNGRREATTRLDACLRLLSKPRAPAGSVVIKPSNIANALIPGIMTARPKARAIMMSNSLRVFCRSVHRKGLMGRRWTRRLTAYVQRYAPLDLGLDHAGLFELTDMQVAGLAWLLQQRWFAMLLANRFGERMLTLDGDAFAERPAETLMRTAEHFGLDLDAVGANEIVTGPLFASHAKLGGSYAETVEREATAAHSPVVEEEIEMASVWIEQIARQIGLVLPLAKTSSLLH